MSKVPTLSATCEQTSRRGYLHFFLWNLDKQTLEGIACHLTKRPTQIESFNLILHADTEHVLSDGRDLAL